MEKIWESFYIVDTLLQIDINAGEIAKGERGEANLTI